VQGYFTAVDQAEIVIPEWPFPSIDRINMRVRMGGNIIVQPDRAATFKRADFL